MQKSLHIKFIRVLLLLVCCFTSSIAAKAQSWQPVGPDDFASSTGFSGGTAIDLTIALDGNETPYVAYRDDSTPIQGATVKKYNGSNWVNVGPPNFSTGAVQETFMAIHTNGTPYIVYADRTRGIKAVVQKFNGNNWEYVGLPSRPEFSTGP